MTERITYLERLVYLIQQALEEAGKNLDEMRSILTDAYNERHEKSSEG